MTTTETTATALEFLEVFSTGDVDAILDRLSDDVDWWVSGELEGFSGSHTKAEMGQLLAGVTDAYKDGALRVTPMTTTAEGGRVAVEVEAYGELANGRVYRPRSTWIFEVADRKITQIREYLDTHHAHAVFFA